MTVWTNIPAEQQAFVRSLDSKILQLRRRVSPVTLYTETTPTNADIAEGWNTAKGSPYNPEPYEILQWMDPATNTLKNHYLIVEDLAGPLTSNLLYNPVSFPTAPQPWTKLGEINIGEVAGAVTQSILSIPQNYNHLMAYVQWRDTNAATTVNLTIRINASAAASYAANIQNVNSAHVLGSEQVSAVGWTIPVPANTSNRTYYMSGLLFIPDYNRTDRPTRMFFRGGLAWGNPHTAATTNGYFVGGIFNSLAAVTSLSFVGITGAGPGTRIVLYGL